MRSCGRCYDNSKRSLVVVRTFVLRLKAANSFLRDQSMHLRPQLRGSAEKSGLRGCEKSRFHPEWAKIRINRGLLYWIVFLKLHKLHPLQFAAILALI